MIVFCCVLPASNKARDDDDDDDDVRVCVFTSCSAWPSKGAVGGCRRCNSLHDGMDSTRRAEWTHHWLSLLVPVQ